MKSAIRFSLACVCIASWCSAAAVADHMVSRSEARKAVQCLKDSNRSLTDVIKKAEAQTGGTAIAVSLHCASGDRMGTDDRSTYTQDTNRSSIEPAAANRTATNDPNSSKAQADANLQNQNSQNRDTQFAANKNGKDKKLEYRVTVLVNDSQLKDVYVCGESGEVAMVRNANQQTRMARYGDDSMNRYGDQFAGDRPFRDGPDGRYERIMVWHFVPNNGDSSRSWNGDNQNEDRFPRTAYDPNPANHHPAASRDGYAQNQNDRYATDDNRGQPFDGDRNQNRNQPGDMKLATKILNASVTNSEGQDLGDVDDIAINPDNGEVLYTAVAYGGFIGIGEKKFAVPCEEINHVADNKIYVSLDKSELENNPGFKDNQWPTQPDAALANGQSTQQPAKAAPAQIAKVSDIIGKPLKTQGNEQLGTIDNVVIDSTADRVAYLVVDPDGRDGLVAIPCAAADLQGDKCVVNITKERFGQLPTFQEGNYPAWTSATWNERTHQDFNVQPYWRTQANVGNVSSNSSASAAR